MLTRDEWLRLDRLTQWAEDRGLKSLGEGATPLDRLIDFERALKDAPPEDREGLLVTPGSESPT